MLKQKLQANVRERTSKPSLLSDFLGSTARLSEAKREMAGLVQSQGRRH